MEFVLVLKERGHSHCLLEWLPVPTPQGLKREEYYVRMDATLESFGLKVLEEAEPLPAEPEP